MTFKEFVVIFGDFFFVITVDMQLGVLASLEGVKLIFGIHTIYRHAFFVLVVKLFGVKGIFKKRTAVRPGDAENDRFKGF